MAPTILYRITKHVGLIDRIVRQRLGDAIYFFSMNSCLTLLYWRQDGCWFCCHISWLKDFFQQLSTVNYSKKYWARHFYVVYLLLFLCFALSKKVQRSHISALNQRCVWTSNGKFFSRRGKNTMHWKCDHNFHKWAEFCSCVPDWFSAALSL